MVCFREGGTLSVAGKQDKGCCSQSGGLRLTVLEVDRRTDSAAVLPSAGKLSSAVPRTSRHVADSRAVSHSASA